MLDRLQDVFECLKKHKVRYLVIGGIAAVLYGVPRATFDLDILIDAEPDNVRNLLNAFREAGLATALLTSVEDVLAAEVMVFKDIVRIDVQTYTPGIQFKKAWKNKNTVQYHKTDLHVVSRNDLIASKIASGRKIDLEDVEILQMDE